MANSGISKYKFISPSVQIAEVDQSQLPKNATGIGPLVIGRFERGPSMRPIKVESFSEFVEIFGNPIPGGKGDDTWRNGNYLAPTYAAYAAQAWLKNNAPLTVLRLLGVSNQNRLTGGEAGWATAKSPTAVATTNGGSYGLFIVDKDASSTGALNLTGTLAAVWYLETGSIVLSGTNRASTDIARTAMLIESVGADKEFKVKIDSGGATYETVVFNFNENSDKYIRKVFNTNPTLVNSNITPAANRKTYWLGESFERMVATQITSSTATNQYGVILAIASGSTHSGKVQLDSTPAKTGWFFSQDLTHPSGSGYNVAQMPKLFRFVCLDTGEWDQKNLKVSIQDIKPSVSPTANPYGTFSVVIRKMSDNDTNIQVVEQFNQCNLNPFSVDYVARKIGDRYTEWNDTAKVLKTYGSFDNQSKFIRVEVDQNVEGGTVPPESLPFGVYGPPRFKGFTFISGNTSPLQFGSTSTTEGNPYVLGATDIFSGSTDTSFITVGSNAFTGSFVFPFVPLRSDSKTGSLSNETSAYFGVNIAKTGDSTKFDPSVVDILRTLPSNIDESASAVQYSWVFTLDDISGSGGSNATGNATAYYSSGSYAAGTSVNAVSGGYNNVLSAGFDKFTTVFYGGFDGLNIKYKEPFSDNVTNGTTEVSNYAYNTIKRATDMVADSEVIEYNLVVMPNVTNTSLTTHLIDVCEARGDALAIIDIPNVYTPQFESTNTFKNRLGSVAQAISSLKARQLNTSYGCTYYPWVQIRDNINDAIVWCPPSVVALGAMGASETKSALWFAPAGFTRGGLTDGGAGVPVLGVSEHLTAKDRDKLYDVNINPIASFPSEGIVIFGQKTLQVTKSALDRINVRRLLIFVKKRISQIASRTLFDQNTRVTWERFKSQVEPFLANIKTNLGLEAFKVVLDETTTTPDLVDRNTMYAKIFLKPTKAVEFIAVDFVITSQSAGFDD